MQFEPEGLRRLLIDMLDECDGNVAELARQIHASDKIVRGWIKADGGDALRRLKSSSIDSILEAAASLEVQAELYARPARLWDWRLSYDENVSRPVPIPPALGRPVQDHRIEFLGFTLASRFGISASILTSTALRAHYFAHTCCDTVTLRTFRTKVFDAWDTPNVRFCGPRLPVLSPDSELSGPIALVDADDGTAASLGMVNHFGVPSLSPAESKLILKGGQSALRNSDRQLVIQSVIGTGGDGVPRTKLIDDFVAAAVIATEAGASAIEINGSCPNADGEEGKVYHDAELAGEIMRQVRAAIGDTKLLFKTGYLRSDDARRLMHAIAPSADAIVSMNTLPVRGVIRGPRGDIPVFHGLEAGLSGDPIREYGLRAVANFAAIRKEDHLDHVGIVGIGGVTAPEHVHAYLEAGADIVQATSVFFDQPLFGIRVRRSLDRARDLARMSVEDQSEVAYFNWRRAYDKLRKAGKGITESSAQTVWLRFHDGLLAAAESGTRRSGTGFTVEDFERKLLATLGIRP